MESHACLTGLARIATVTPAVVRTAPPDDRDTDMVGTANCRASSAPTFGASVSVRDNAPLTRCKPGTTSLLHQMAGRHPHAQRRPGRDLGQHPQCAERLGHRTDRQDQAERCLVEGQWHQRRLPAGRNVRRIDVLCCARSVLRGSQTTSGLAKLASRQSGRVALGGVHLSY